MFGKITKINAVFGWFIFLFCVFLPACCVRSSTWILQRATSDCIEYDGACLTCLCSNRFNGVEFQLLRGCFGLWGYLQIYAGCIPESPNQTCRVFLQIDEKQYAFDCIVLAGNQKVLLPDAAMQLIIDALQNSFDVGVYIEGGFGALIPSHRFSKLFARIQ